jgi:hypothetical protein
MQTFDFIGQQDDDDADVADMADQTRGPFINPRDAIVEAALAVALAPHIRHRLARADQPIAILVRVPASNWVAPVDKALEGHYPHLATASFTDVRKRSTAEEDGGLLARLRAGTSIAAISPDPDGLVPAALRLVADVVMSVDVPAVPNMKKIIRRVTGSRRVPELAPADYAGLDLNVLAACMRRGDTAAMVVERLRRIGRNRILGFGGKPVPTLDALPLTDGVRAWTEQMRAELCAADAGTLSPAALGYAVLEGPPGTGKTLIANALAATTGWTFIPTSVGAWFTVGDGALGAVARNIKIFVDQVIGTDRSIGFLDELDALPNRADMDNRGRDWWTPVITLFLTEIDRVQKSGRRALVLSATNYYGRLDSALIRLGRLQQRVSVLPPQTDEEVLRVLRFYAGTDLDDTALRRLSRFGRGNTPATIEAWFRQARGAARTANRPLSFHDLFDLAAPPDSRSPADIRAVAAHEVGHAVVALTLGMEVAEISIISDDILFGEGPNAGAENDLVRATELLLAARERQGLFGSLVSIQPARLGLRPDAATSRLIDAELKRLLGGAIDIIESCRPAALEMIERLIQERVLDGGQVLEVMRRHASVRPIAGREHPPSSS